MFVEYDRVRLITSLNEGCVPVGATGTIVMVFTEPETGYEIEFFDGNGRSFGTTTIYSADIAKIAAV